MAAVEFSASRKRLRSDDAAVLPRCDHTTRRNALASRVKQVPRVWCHPASAAGTAGVDEFLRFLGRSIGDAISDAQEISNSARGQLRDFRQSIHAAVDSRFDELEMKVNSMAAAKSAALERELVTVDAALQRWREDGSSICTTMSAVSDAELDAQHAALSSRIDDMEVQLSQR